MQRRANVLEAAHVCKIAAGDEELRDLSAYSGSQARA